MVAEKQSVGVIGSGSWATAMVKMLGDNDVDKSVYWWVRNTQTADYIRNYKHNPNYLSAVTVKIPKRHIHVDARAVAEHADILILNTPAAFLKDALRDIPPAMLKNKIIVSAIKGIVPDENQIVGDYLQEQLHIPIDNIVVIGGPCHAEEVSLEKLSYLTVASQNTDAAKSVAALIGTRYIKTNVSDDIYGTEYAAVLKNIYAVAGGICRGVGFGDNFQAVLVSNALREMAYFVNTVHPITRDIKESVYLGDLLVTAYSQFSRNRTFGNMIGKGYSVKSAQLEMNMVAEGYYAANCIEQICRKHAIELPICHAVYRVLYEQQQPVIEMKTLADKLT
ncbi:NAD(P)H-dependent glycerol-3-phosphate dehydrogenase [Parapedobacter sp. 10938]|uniref:NAD(P)H-dependent glycerol-3-phosphate dehydrogenase n=1 Tax=Parapedobacter flavus TaxID=3110225 RepID=UPI002DBD033D|nr:NAD(P)H-dependent glycerol-3-phosphate dehydrogenase [Parapedobacter sp. 10938]MEC3880199.1 NAD(P)H-dependent glycerol-3-phosphate dehydrogenase [Parapedobacter sp. 10938]